MTYNAELRQVQDNLDAANILTDVTLDATIVPSEQYERRSTSAWQAKLNAAPTARDNRHTIIRDWLDEIYDADHAIYLFRLFKLHIGSYRGSSYELMAHAAVTEFGAVALPERVTGTIPSVSSSKPFEPVGASAASNARCASTSAHISSSEGRSPDNASRQSSTSSRSDLSNSKVSMSEPPDVCEQEFHAWTNRSQVAPSCKAHGGGK
jgi:hypothetical protein